MWAHAPPHWHRPPAGTRSLHLSNEILLRKSSGKTQRSARRSPKGIGTGHEAPGRGHTNRTEIPGNLPSCRGWFLGFAAWGREVPRGRSWGNQRRDVSRHWERAPGVRLDTRCPGRRVRAPRQSEQTGLGRSALGVRSCVWGQWGHTLDGTGAARGKDEPVRRCRGSMLVLSEAEAWPRPRNPTEPVPRPHSHICWVIC